ncbi:TetR family transcriptional regulator [Parafrankia colletiae]|uniref:TetR family transcriptional regulator n=1 Tax=Parafrankia colletiae TaxID=573497 RepID=A0A1S1QVT3_9ACTN|nr:TetR/AcrR family transcriptional regulator [Parafrankia colletiae]MCK9901843.1 TetR/AcrR family transcriptional regulator [Frankia sp. Cpl3]OHV36544.1 TetR family transcriptional regulator [Parafrankia colletiae]
MKDGDGPGDGDRDGDGCGVLPGSIRPGGRTARVRASVLRAAGDALAEHGFAGLDLADVASRAQVGRTTVYRRWGSAGALVADLLVDMAEQSLARSRTGSLLGDLKENARLVQRTLVDPRQGPLFRAILAAAATDDSTARALRRFYEIRVAEWAGCVDDAVERGEIPAGTDAREVVRAVSAPLYYRLLTTAEPPDETAADRAAEGAFVAAHAGVYLRVRPGAPQSGAAGDLEPPGEHGVGR